MTNPGLRAWLVTFREVFLFYYDFLIHKTKCMILLKGFKSNAFGLMVCWWNFMTLSVIVLVCYFGTLSIVCIHIPTLTASLTFWEHFTCLDVTQCMLNRSITQVALRLIDSNLPSCLPQILNLGVKVSLYFLFILYISFSTFTSPNFYISFLL